jgi:hypothetical protein
MVSPGKVHVWDVHTGKRKQLDIPSEHICLEQTIVLSTNAAIWSFASIAHPGPTIRGSIGCSHRSATFPERDRSLCCMT